MPFLNVTSDLDYVEFSSYVVAFNYLMTANKYCTETYCTLLQVVHPDIVQRIFIFCERHLKIVGSLKRSNKQIKKMKYIFKELIFTYFSVQPNLIMAFLWCAVLIRILFIIHYFKCQKPVNKNRLGWGKYMTIMHETDSIEKLFSILSTRHWYRWSDILG